MSSAGMSFFGLAFAVGVGAVDARGGMAVEGKVVGWVDGWGWEGCWAGLSLRRSDAVVKKGFTGLEIVEVPLTDKELEFRALRG